MLTILRDPAGVTGIDRHPLDFSITLQANIERHLPHGGDAELRINGQKVDPLTDPRLDAPPSRFDRVTVVQRPAGVETLAYIALAGAVLGVVAAFTLIPDINTPAGAKESPNNGLTGQTNIARTYQAIPDVYGLRRVWPDLIQPSTIEYIDHIKYVTEWLCVSRGQGTITDVQYAETAIEDVAGASFEVFEPVSLVEPELPGSLAGYPEFQYCLAANVVETFAAPDVNGQEMPAPAEPVSAVFPGAFFVATSGSATFTLRVTDGEATAPIKALVPSGNAFVSFSYGNVEAGTNGELTADLCQVTAFSVASGKCTFTLVHSTTFPNSYSENVPTATIEPDAATVDAIVGPFTLPVECDRIRWNTVFPRGLKGTVNIEATWEELDSGGSVLSTETDDFDYTANTADGRYFTTEVTPAAGSGRYRIRFRRTTAEIGSGLYDLAKLEAVYATRYYATKALLGVTVIRVTTKATEQATGFSDRKFNLRWNRHVRTLTTDTLSASRNFARTMAHIWTIAGKDIAELDTTKLAAINTEFGETDELLRFDYSFDDRDVSLGERLQIVANHARCVVWRDGTKWTVTRDQARQYPELQFDYRNLAAGGDAVISVAAHLPASFDGVELEYVDETTQREKAYIRLDITSGSVTTGATLNPKKIQLPGCTTEAQAENRARLEARKLLYQRTSIQDTALADAMTVGVGALVRYIDPNDFAGDDGLQAGEVMTIDGTTITTSEALDFGAETSGRILFTGDDGARLAAPVVCTPNDDGSVELASVPSGLYVRGATRQLGSRYAFAVGLTEAETEAAGLYLLTEVRPNGTGTASISLASYDARIYADD